MKGFSKILFVLIVMLTACSPSAPSASQPGIEISNANVVLPGGDAMGGMGLDSTLGAYMQIKNNSATDDRLIAVTSDFAEATTLHETAMNGDVATMNGLTSIDIPAGTTIELKHGGLHIMFMDPTKDLKVGDSVNLVLEFEKAGKLTVSAKVTDQ
ncbi:MAG: copper chaperone PCu(A)C [Chloroflexota bacterium]